MSEEVMTRVIKASTGLGLTQDLGHFTLGYYYIDAELLEPHPTQRPIDPSHITSLLKEFTEHNLLHLELSLV